MNENRVRKPAQQGNTLYLAIAGLGVGLWCLLSHEWADEKKYFVPSQLTDSGEIRDGRDMNRNRRIIGGVFLSVGLYCTYCLVRKKSTIFATRDSDPEVILQVVPTMPPALDARSVAGGATVEFVISTEGHVTDARVFYATHPEFGEAALSAIRQWKFKPALHKNVPLALRALQSVEFTPEGLINLNQGSFRA